MSPLSTITLTSPVLEALLSLTLRRPSQNPLDLFNCLKEIIQRFTHSESESELYGWGKNVIQDIEAGKTFTRAEFDERIRAFDELIQKCTNGGTQRHPFAEEMDRWKKSLPENILDFVSQVSKEVISAERENKIAADVQQGSISSVESPEIAALRLLELSLQKRKQRELQRARILEITANKFKLFEKELKASTDETVARQKEELEKHEKATKQRIEGIEKIHQETIKNHESQIASIKGIVGQAQANLAQAIREKDEQILLNQEFQRRMREKELEVEELANKKKHKCIIM